jgi:hypothetical protein
MPYVSFEVEFQNPDALRDLNAPIDVLRAVLAVIPPENLRGYNFNRYYSPSEGLHHPNMDLRVNLDNVEQSREPIKNALRALAQQGVIRCYGPEPRSWAEPQFVIDAHEASTRCAINFVEGLKKEAGLAQYMKEHPSEFMTHFVRLLLEFMGLRPYVAWTYLRIPPPEGLDDLARRCAMLVSNQFGAQKKKADFLERFLHTFFNCTVGAMEGKVMGALSGSLFWKSLTES